MLILGSARWNPIIHHVLLTLELAVHPKVSLLNGFHLPLALLDERLLQSLKDRMSVGWQWPVKKARDPDTIILGERWAPCLHPLEATVFSLRPGPHQWYHPKA